MKKLGIVLALVLVCACLMSVCAFAAGNSFSVKAKDTVEAGEQFTVTVDLSTEGILLLNFTVKYDSNVFEFVSKEIPGFVKNNTDTVDATGEVYFSLGDDLSTENVTGTGTVANITFKAKTDADGKSGAFTATYTYACDADFNDITISDGSATVKVGSGEAPHTHEWDEGTVTKEPTCTEKGVKTFKCKGCDETKTEEIAALGHDWDEGVVTKEPTESEEGVKTFTCSRCGETKTESIPKKDHTHEAAEELQGVKEATCTEKGYTGDKVCKICGEVMEAGTEIPAKGHTPAAELKDKKDATCTEKGYTGDKVCSVCGAVIEAGKEIAALGHDYEEKVTKEATCTEKGEKELTCKRCGDKKTDEIPALGHDWDEGKVKVPATETEDGVGTKTCKRCGATEDYTIPKTGGNGGAVKPDGNKQQTNKKNDNPKTGDETNVAIYAGILVLCGAATVAVVSKKKNHG